MFINCLWGFERGTSGGRKEELDLGEMVKLTKALSGRFAVHLSVWERGMYLHRALRECVFLPWGYLKSCPRSFCSHQKKIQWTGLCSMHEHLEPENEDLAIL